MSSYNRVVIMGNLTRNPELRYTQGGTAVAEIGLAINEKRKGRDGELSEETVFVDATLWGRTAEVADEFTSKGSPVLIEGRLKLDIWEKDGRRHSKLKVTGEKLQLLGSGKSGGKKQGNVAAPRQSAETPSEEIPF